MNICSDARIDTWPETQTDTWEKIQGLTFLCGAGRWSEDVWNKQSTERWHCDPPQGEWGHVINVKYKHMYTQGYICTSCFVCVCSFDTKNPQSFSIFVEYMLHNYSDESLTVFFRAVESRNLFSAFRSTKKFSSCVKVINYCTSVWPWASKMCWNESTSADDSFAHSETTDNHNKLITHPSCDWPPVLEDC